MWKVPFSFCEWIEDQSALTNITSLFSSGKWNLYDLFDSCIQQKAAILQESRKSKHYRLWHFLPRIIPQDIITKKCERNQRNASPYHIHEIVRENNFDPWCLLSRGSCTNVCIEYLMCMVWPFCLSPDLEQMTGWEKKKKKGKKTPCFCFESRIKRQVNTENFAKK